MCVDLTYSRACCNRDILKNDLSFFPEEIEKGTLFIDVNSIARNTTSASAACRILPAAAGTFIAVSSVAGGAIGFPVGLCILRDGYIRAKAAFAASDWEGTAHKVAWAGVGASYAGLSSLLATNGIMALAGRAAPASIGTAFGGLGIGFYGLILGYAAYGYRKTSQFRTELRKAVADGRAAQWIREQVTLNQDESALPEIDKAKLLQKKWNQFELKTNAQCGKLIRDRILQGAPIDDLILEVEKASFKESVKHILLIVLGLLGIAASLCILFSSGISSAILFASSAVLWIGIDSSSIHNYLGEKFWSWFSPSPTNDSGEKKEEHPTA